MTDHRRGGQSHHHAASSSNNKHAQLVNAYQELGRELGSEKLTIVGGYTLGRVIGEGTYGSVHMAIHRLTGMRCAIKKIPKSQTPSLTREIHHHRRLHHPSIVQLYEIIATENHIWLVTELCSGGELFDYLVEKKRFQEGEARRLFGELVVAVGYLHRQGVVHRDLKLENILLDGHLKVKLGDLGFAREFRRGQLMDTFCGTIGYASPEMLAGRKYLGVETDIWSLGIILYTLLCGGMPFDDDDERAMKSHIMKGEYEEPEWISQESKSLLRDLLRTDPAERLSIDAILAHPWFKMTLRDRSDPIEPIAEHPSHLSPHSSIERSTSSSPPGSTPSHPISIMPGLHQTISPSPLGMTNKPSVPGPASDTSETSQDLDSEHGQPASDSTAPTTVEEDDLAKSLPRNSSIEFSNTEQMLELLHPNTSQSTIRKPAGDTGPSAPVKAKVAIKSPLEGQLEEDEDGDSTHSLSQTAHPPLLPTLQHSRTPSRTKRRSVSSSLSLERRASYISNSGDFDLHPTVDYTVQLLEERPAVFSTTAERQLLDSFRMLGVDVEQMQHSVKHNACDTSASMWWILRAKRDQESQDAKSGLLPSQVIEKPINGHSRGGASPRAGASKTPSTNEIELATSRSSTERELEDPLTKASGSRSPRPSGKTTPPNDTPPTAGSSRTPTPGGPSPYRNGKTRSPSMSMLQRATSAFTGAGRKTEERESTEVEEAAKGDGRGSPTKLHKPPPKAKKPDVVDLGPVVPLNSPIAEGPSGTRFVEEDGTGISPSARGRLAKRESIWTAFRYFFNEDKRRRREPTTQTKATTDSPSTTVLLSRGPVARHQAGPLRTPQPLPSHRRSIDGRPPLYSRRSSSVNSRRSSVTSNMVPPDHRDAINALARRVSHKSHGSLTPTSEQEIEYRPESFHHHGLRQSQYIRSPSMQSDTSGRFHAPAPASPLHDYHRRPPAGSSSARVRHFRVIPETTMQRTNSVASSIRSTASSRASSIDKGWAGSGGDDTSLSSKRSRERKRTSPKPRTRAARVAASRPPLRDVFEDKDEEWVDEDEFGNERRALAGGVGQGQAGGQTAFKAVDSRAASHPGNWNAGHHKRRHRHPRSRRGSTDEISPTDKRADEGIPKNQPPGPTYGRRNGPVGRPRQPAVVMEEDEEE